MFDDETHSSKSRASAASGATDKGKVDSQLLSVPSSKPISSFSSKGSENMAKTLKPSVVKFLKLDWWKQEHHDMITAKSCRIKDFLAFLRKEVNVSDIAEQKKDVDAKRAATVEKAVGEKEPIEEQEAIQEHEATVKKASKEPYKKALKDLLFPIPNAKPTRLSEKSKCVPPAKGTACMVVATSSHPFCQALGKIICAFHPVRTRYQLNETKLTGMLEYRSEVHRPTDDKGRSTRVDNVIGFFAEELLEVMIRNSKLALKVSGASNITVSFVEVKLNLTSWLEKGVVTEQSFQDVQDLCEVWEKKSVARRNKANTWKEVTPRENALYYVYPTFSTTWSSIRHLSGL
ncbi:hypothetical protein BT69DRAFT_1293255 [Atractiella rhizophila]|nr:hypothetical protein BT69DRAFT_1293255 [Atractiella rhizophila]